MAVAVAGLAARRFRPSLSGAVHDALFGFWRLPRATRHALDNAVPCFSVESVDATLHACLDWHGLLLASATPVDVVSASGDGCHAIHVACALACHAEVVFDKRIANLLVGGSETVKIRLATDATVAHGSIVRRILSSSLQIETGDAYMAFVVLITVLEKALYDLYYGHDDGGREGKKKNMILRDLLHSSVLEKVLPPGMMVLLKTLFLPSGLNLRNLVWHGFLIPAQFPRCFACLTALLLLELPRFFGGRRPTDSSALFQLSSFDDRFVVPKELQRALQAIKNWNMLIPSSSNDSSFIPHGRERLVERAFTHLMDEGDELWFLFALLPVLEHAVRVEFVRRNTELYGLALEDFSVAQIDQYYSTLDGFGQRGKHQVLLHAEIAGLDDPMALNALYRTTPRAAMAVCLDLFMMAAGPNVRAKMCHGEADLSALLAPRLEEDRHSISVISLLVLLTWITLCQSNCREGEDTNDAKRQRLEHPPPVIAIFKAMMGSSFHPFVQLRRLADTCKARLEAFRLLCNRWSHSRAAEYGTDEDSGSTDSLSRVEFLLDSHRTESSDVLLAIVDKTARVREFECFFDGAPTPSTPVQKPKTFVELLVALRSKVSDTLDMVGAHNESVHTAIDRVITPPRDDDQLQRCLLALSDADGLSVSACMMDILASVDRSLVSFESRLKSLAAVIQDGSARTNQRRAFLNNVYLLPVFERLQRLALCLVDHQIHHLETTALYRAVAITSGTIETPPSLQLCPDARKFEQLQRKLLQFVTAFEGCTGSAEGAQKSNDKALQLALQFVESKALRTVLA